MPLNIKCLHFITDTFNAIICVPTDDGEADSFIGQGPNVEEQTPFSCFQQQPPGGAIESLFTHTSASAPSMPGGSPMPPRMTTPLMGSTPNPGRGMTSQLYRLYFSSVLVLISVLLKAGHGFRPVYL